jgi:hypothetical protein
VKQEIRAAEAPPQSATPHVQNADTSLETARTWERPLLIPLDLADAQNNAGGLIHDGGVCS